MKEPLLTAPTSRMQKAILALFEEMDFANITVSALCRHAEINRSVFYAHYANMSDLLYDTQRALVASFFAQYSKADHDHSYISEECLYSYLMLVQEHAPIFRAYLGNAVLFNQQHLLDSVNQYLLDTESTVTGSKKEYFVEAALAGANCMAMKWLHGNCKDDARAVARAMADYMHHTLGCKGVSA